MQSEYTMENVLEGIASVKRIASQPDKFDFATLHGAHLLLARDVATLRARVLACAQVLLNAEAFDASAMYPR
jgi:hypothetical protein